MTDDKRSRRADTSGDREDNNLRWLKQWWERYEARLRTSTKTIRFSEAEWQHVEERAGRAELPPATYLRVVSLAEHPDLEVDERLLTAYCAVLCRLLDLVLRNPSSLAHLGEAHHLRRRLEGIHSAVCHPKHRSDDYEPPPGIDEKEEIWPDSRRRPRSGAWEAEPNALRTVTKTVRFRDDEWIRVEKRACRAGVAPAVFVRLMSVGARPDHNGNERVLGLFCELAQKVRDLVARQPQSTEHLAEAQELVGRLDAMTHEHCGFT